MAALMPGCWARGSRDGAGLVMDRRSRGAGGQADTLSFSLRVSRTLDPRTHDARSRPVCRPGRPGYAPPGAGWPGPPGRAAGAFLFELLFLPAAGGQFVLRPAARPPGTLRLSTRATPQQDT